LYKASVKKTIAFLQLLITTN